MGLLAAPASVDLVRTSLRELGSTHPAGLEAVWQELEEKAGGVLARQGLAPEVVARSADCRYRGQAFELEVPVPPGVPVEDAGFAVALAGNFHAAHLERYGYAHDSEVVELVNLRVRADAPRPRFSLPLVPEGAGADAARRAVRSVVLQGRPVDCVVYAREALGAGDRLAGPALVAGVDSTCLLLAGQSAEVDGFGNLLIREG
jgi:N-methylhydantoinase A